MPSKGEGAFGRLVARYLDERTPAWSKRTLDHTRQGLVHFVRHLAERRQGLSRESVVSFILAVQDMRRRDGREWAKRTKDWPLLALRGLLKWALLRGLVLEDLASLIVVKPVKALPRPLRERDISRVIDAGCQGIFAARDRAILETMYGTGLRVSEVGRLEVTDVALQESLVHVRNGKGGKDRVVPLGERARLALVAYLRERPRCQGPLFLSSYLRPLSPSMLWRIVRRSGRRVEVQASPHRLRHSYATHLLRNGAALPAVKVLLGHGSLASTEVYLGVEVSDLTRMIERCHPRERG